MLSRGSLIILASLLFLAGSVFFSYKAKKDYLTQVQNLKQEIKEVRQTKDLQRLWRANSMKSKLEKALASFNKKLKINRKKATISASNLDYKTLNKMLNKLASLPLQFRDLKVTKSGDKFNLECVCVW
jgi:CBS-domain-containing membrane protein